MRLIILVVVAAVLVQGYLSATVNGPSEDSKDVVKRQAPSLPNYMGGFRPSNMGAMGAPGMGAMRPGMGAMGPPGLGGMGPSGFGGMGPSGLGGIIPPGFGGMLPPHMPPNMFRPPNFADAQASNSSDGQSFGFGWSVANDQGNPTEYNGNRTEYNGNRTEYHGNRTEYHGNRTVDH